MELAPALPSRARLHAAPLSPFTSGVKRFHAHQLRHTFACRYLEHGGRLETLQELLGHSTVVTTKGTDDRATSMCSGKPPRSTLDGRVNGAEWQQKWQQKHLHRTNAMIDPAA
jgi:hypothetical protein